MIDHAPRIRAQQQAAIENIEMANLEQRAAPLQWALIVAILVLVIGAIVDQSREAIQRYTDMAAANEAMVQCLNGHLLRIDNVLVSCTAHTGTLVAQVKP